MTKSEFFEEMNRLANVYSQKLFPKERVDVLWDSFGHLNVAPFRAAVSAVILSMPHQSQLIQALSGRIKDELSRKELGSEQLPVVKPVNNAKELADRYAPGIMDLLKGVTKELPYDPEVRITPPDPPIFKDMEELGFIREKDLPF